MSFIGIDAGPQIGPVARELFARNQQRGRGGIECSVQDL